jgi:hypothetical protein
VRTTITKSSPRRDEALRPISTNLLGMFFLQNSHKNVILSEALRRSIANRGLYSAESKDPERAYPTHAVRTLSTAEARTWRTRHGLSRGREPIS